MIKVSLLNLKVVVHLLGIGVSLVILSLKNNMSTLPMLSEMGSASFVVSVLRWESQGHLTYKA